MDTSPRPPTAKETFDEIYKKLGFLSTAKLVLKSGLIGNIGIGNILKMTYYGLKESKSELERTLLNTLKSVDDQKLISTVLDAMSKNPIKIEIPHDPTKATTIYDRVINKVLLSEETINNLVNSNEKGTVDKNSKDYQAFKHLLLATKVNMKGNILDSIIFGDLADTKLTQEKIDALESAARQLGEYEQQKTGGEFQTVDKIVFTFKLMTQIFNYLNYIIPVMVKMPNGTEQNSMIWSMLFQKIFYVAPDQVNIDLQLTMKDLEFMLAVVIYIMAKDKNNPGLAEKNPLNLIYQHHQMTNELKQVLETVILNCAKIVANEHIFKYLVALFGLNNSQTALNATNLYNKQILSPTSVNKLRGASIQSFSGAIKFVFDEALKDSNVDFLKLTFLSYILDQHNIIDFKYKKIEDLATPPEQINKPASRGPIESMTPTTAYEPVFLSKIMKPGFNKDTIYNSPYYKDTLDEIIYSGSYPLFAQFITTTSIDSVFTQEQRNTLKKFKIPAPHTLFIVQSLAPELKEYFQKDMGIFRMIFYVLPYLIPKPALAIDTFKFALRIYRTISGEDQAKPFDFSGTLPIFNELFRRVLYVIEHKNIITSHQSKLRRIILASNVFVNVTALVLKYKLSTEVLIDKRLDIGTRNYDITKSLSTKISKLIYLNTPESLNTLLHPIYAGLNNMDMTSANTTKYFTDAEFVAIFKIFIYQGSIDIYDTEKSIHSTLLAEEMQSDCLLTTEDQCGTMKVQQPISIPYTPLGPTAIPPMFAKTELVSRIDPNSTCRWSKTQKRCIPRINAEICSKHTNAETCDPSRRTKKASKGRREISRSTDSMCRWDTDLGKCEVRDMTKVIMHQKYEDLKNNPYARIYNFLRYLFTYSMRVSHLTIEQALEFNVVDGVMYCEETHNILNLINTARPQAPTVYMTNPDQKIYYLHLA